MLTEVGKAIKHTAPHVSVVMGIYNCAHTLPKAIESILNQTYDKWELILCDDCSTDNTYSVAQEYAQKIRASNSCATPRTLDATLY